MFVYYRTCLFITGRFSGCVCLLPDVLVCLLPDVFVCLLPNELLTSSKGVRSVIEYLQSVCDSASVS